MNRKKILLTIFLILLLSNLGLTQGATDTADLSGTFTTANGTLIYVNATIEHDDTDTSKPTFSVNHSYSLKIKLTVKELGADVIDIHDVSFTITLFSSSFLSSDINYYNGYYFDSETRYEENDSKTYDVEIFLSGDTTNRDARLDVELLFRENISKDRDPTSSFDAIALECEVNPNSEVFNVTTFGTEFVDRSIQSYADKDSKISFEISVSHDGLDNETNKPMISTFTRYSMNINVTVLELGSDAVDFHDISIRASIEDESLASIIPGNDPSLYFSMAIDDSDTVLLEGDIVSYSAVLYAATNVNNTEVTLTIELSGKENIPDGLDPKSEFELSVGFVINKGVTNVFDDLLSETSEFDFNPLFGLLLVFVAVPITRRRKNN